MLNKCYITTVPIDSSARTSTKKLAQCPRKSRTDCSIGKKKPDKYIIGFTLLNMVTCYTI